MFERSTPHGHQSFHLLDPEPLWITATKVSGCLHGWVLRNSSLPALYIFESGKGEVCPVPKVAWRYLSWCHNMNIWFLFNDSTIYSSHNFLGLSFPGAPYPDSHWNSQLERFGSRLGWLCLVSVSVERHTIMVGGPGGTRLLVPY